jgi:hypothetical protein
MESTIGGGPFGLRLSEGLGCNAPNVTRERPILFSAPMVRALMAGTKTQTRRVVKGAPTDWAPMQPQVFAPTVIDRHGDEQPGPDAYGAGNEDGDCWIRCPYGEPGDRLWVRESWARDDEDGQVMYRADIGHEACADAWEQGRIEGVPRYKWKPSIHMPRRICRLVLTLESVRVERLNDISRGDAMAEGCPFQNMAEGPDPRQWYADLWDQINGQGSWNANPWVWVLAFSCGPNLQPNVGIEPPRSGRLE